MRRFTVAWLRAAEAVARSLGARPWKIDRFNRLIQADVAAAVASIGSARAVVGIPFHKEAGNIAALVATTLSDLQSRGEPAAIVIVGERKSRSVLLKTALPAATDRVRIVTFFKPFGFGQRPGLARRSWSHWAILHVAHRLAADVVFIDADVRNSGGWVSRYLDAISHQGADVAVANYVRRFDADDAIVHVWDRLIFGAVFRKWIAFRHGGDYAVSGRLLGAILDDPWILRERAYTLDSAVIAHVVRNGGRVESLWLGAKQHEPITPGNLFGRLETLVRSVFDDVDRYLAAVLRSPGEGLVSQQQDVPDRRRMRDLMGSAFRRELHAHMAASFHTSSSEIRRTLGAADFERFAVLARHLSPEQVMVAPRDWAKATIRFLARYVRTRDEHRKSHLAKACVPILEAGILAFLNRTHDLSYAEAFRLLDDEYLPAFQSTWDSLARRLAAHRLSRLYRISIPRLDRALDRRSRVKSTKY